MARIIYNGVEIASTEASYSTLINKPQINGHELQPGYNTAQELEITWIGTQNEFDNLGTKNPNCVYVITEDQYAVLKTAAGEVMRGADEYNDGSEGLVPQPKAGDENKVLTGAGAWVAVGNAPYEGATATEDGVKGIVPQPQAGQQNCILKGSGGWVSTPGINGNYEYTDQDAYYGVPTTPGTNGQLLVSNGDNTAAWKTYTTAVPIMVGATEETEGQAGLVPAPPVGTNNYLSSDGTWKTPCDSQFPEAFGTSTNFVTERDVYNGLPKINNSKIYDANQNLVVPTSNGSDGYVWTSNGDGTGSWKKPYNDVFTATENGCAPMTNGVVGVLSSEATWKQVSDSTTSEAIGTSSNLVTERDVFNGLPYINEEHNYTSASNYYAVPTVKGAKGQVWSSKGDGTGEWKNIKDSTQPSALAVTDAIVTERAVYYALPTINGRHDYISTTNYYAVPTTQGTMNQLWCSKGDGTGTWKSISEFDAFTGCTATTPGTGGLVPAPPAGKQDLFLCGDGTWKAAPAASNFKGATDSTNGTQGVVPAPTKGQQNYILCGDGAWRKVKSNGTSLEKDSTGFVDEATVYNCTPLINDTHDYTSDTKFYCLPDSKAPAKDYVWVSNSDGMTGYWSSSVSAMTEVTITYTPGTDWIQDNLSKAYYIGNNLYYVLISSKRSNDWKIPSWDSSTWMTDLTINGERARWIGGLQLYNPNAPGNFCRVYSDGGEYGKVILKNDGHTNQTKEGQSCVARGIICMY